MYCKYCGKNVEGNADVCCDCANEILGKKSFANENVSYYNDDKTNRMSGFKPALTGCILGTVGLIFAFISYFVSIANIAYGCTAYGSLLYSSTAINLTLIILALGFVVPTLILGIKSLVYAFQRKKQGNVLPIPTLALGGVSIGFSLIMIIFNFISVIINVVCLYGVA